MLEIPERLNYAEWDDANFTLPQEFILNENAFLHEAIYVFYAAGGYDFFKVVNTKKYATRWLEFVGELYSAIVAGKYKKDLNNYESPLSESERNSLIKQGVPKIFTNRNI